MDYRGKRAAPNRGLALPPGAQRGAADVQTEWPVFDKPWPSLIFMSLRRLTRENIRVA